MKRTDKLKREIDLYNKIFFRIAIAVLIIIIILLFMVVKVQLKDDFKKAVKEDFKEEIRDENKDKLIVKNLVVERNGVELETEDIYISFPVWTECNKSICSVFNYEELYEKENGSPIKGAMYNISCSNSSMLKQRISIDTTDGYTTYTTFWCELE